MTPRRPALLIGLLLGIAGAIVLTLLTHPHVHRFPGVGVYGQHLYFDAIADAGGYYASSFCKHWYHRVPIAIAFALATTYALVIIVG